jgi:hypothetical protein
MAGHRVDQPLRAGPGYRITTKPLGVSLEPDEVRVKTHRDVLNEFRTHPEPKSLGPDGRPCHRGTVGWLSRRPVTPTSITYTGPQRKIEEAIVGLVTNPDELEQVYAKERFAPVSELVRRVIESFGESATETAQRAGVDRKTVMKVRRGEPLDRIRREALGRCAVEEARELVKAADPDAKVRSVHAETLLTRCLELTGHDTRSLWELVCDVIRALPVEQVAAGAGVSTRTVKRARAQQAETAVWVATNERGDQCGHHHRWLDHSTRCCRRMERRYRRMYAGRPGYARREVWISERAHVPGRPEPIGKTARTKLARYAVRHARARLRQAGIRPPAGHEALLAAYLGHRQADTATPAGR